MPYSDVLNHNSDILPVEYASEVIKNVTESSTVLSLSRRRNLSTRQTRLPASSALAGAYWVGESANDFTDLKQTTNAEWKGVNLNVEELAVLVPIPHAYEADNGFPVAEEAIPQISEAMARALDAAALFGVNKPTTWPDSIYDSAVAAGNVSAAGADIALSVADSARLLVETGYATNGFAAAPGTQWRLVGLRNGDGTPIYQQNLAGPITTGLYGFPLVEVRNGAWQVQGDDASDAVLIHGDWSKSIVGVRQDITLTRHESGIITDAEGGVVFNAMQQDATIWRAVFRVAWTRANVATRLGPNADSDEGKFPFAVVTDGAS